MHMAERSVSIYEKKIKERITQYKVLTKNK